MLDYVILYKSLAQSNRRTVGKVGPYHMHGHLLVEAQLPSSLPKLGIPTVYGCRYGGTS